MNKEQQLKTILTKVKQGKLSINVAKRIIIDLFEDIFIELCTGNEEKKTK